ncbi:GGDEF domain-containing protein [Geminicoccaceae bacterium 1502E]|nr:GGDEF domain-containing protein [Geminicoccaceae bacterium 1502E]
MAAGRSWREWARAGRDGLTSRIGGRQAIRDFLVIALVVAVGLAVALGTGVWRLVLGPLEAISFVTAEEVLVVLLVVSVAATLFAVRRVRELREEVRRRALAEERLRFLAEHDALTGLANRALFDARLAGCLAGRRRLDEQVAVLCLDLDRFKEVNDSLGHAAGDTLLRIVGLRLRAQLRPGDTVARLGGDEFVIVLPSVHQGDDALRLARRLVEAISEPVMLEGKEVPVQVSVGVALHPEHAADPGELLRAADQALYQVKAEGGGAVRMFDGRTGQRPVPGSRPRLVSL